MMYGLVRRFLFELDAETAHEFGIAQLERLQSLPPFAAALRAMTAGPQRAVSLWGLAFRNAVGIAGGFDKNAAVISALEILGFGFAEVGTVTLRPQPGNPKPRIFRFPEHHALVNRLGFNNDGAEVVARRLEEWASNPAAARMPLFVNVGKNRDVPIDAAADAYAECYAKVGRFADGAVLNLSSPNTPSLRDLQRPEHLEQLLMRVRSVREQLQFVRGGAHPLLVKIAPDLEDGQIGEICDVAMRLADGMICTNTTIDRSRVPEAEGVAGGLSGAPLLDPSTRVLAQVRRNVGASFPLVGVGGVFDAEDAAQKIAAGADLVQVYTGFIYEGPMLPSRLARALA